jgi:tetratricopeptide (TPR) repeat protein/transcriptional regulator with XRE-family HTH domain
LNGDQALGTGSFGELLRRYRLASGLSQEELAQRAGLSVRALANMERGRTRRPYKRSVRLLAKAMTLSEPQRLQLSRAARLVAGDTFTPSPALTADPAPPDAVPRQPPAADLGQPLAVHAEPHELPAAVRHFTGRAAELDKLSKLAARGGVPALVICAVGGTAGVGKTALAVRWAHQVAERFPDGQLFVNLRGYAPGEPVAAADALAGLLRTLGVPAQEIPDDTEDRARLYRSRLAGRRVLVLLDNARDGEQVRPLLPGDPGCVAVVTSRDALAGLVAADGARRLDLDVLPQGDAVALLRSLIGDRADQDPMAVAALARLCARLPLALRIAAELAAARKAVPLADLVAELREDGLDLLDAGEDRADVRAVFSWSYRQLPEHVARAFAVIGLHPGAELDVYAAAGLTGTTPAQARRMLGRLHQASLLQAVGPGRYSLHDLLRAYAREQAATRDTGGQSRQALTGLFDYYLAAAAAAMDTLFPAEARLRPRIPATGAALPAMTGEAGARAWLDRERANLVAAVVHCAGNAWPGHAVGLAGTLFSYLMFGTHLPEAQTVYMHALHAARSSGDLAAEASALNGLGSIGMIKGRYREAGSHYRAALECYRQCGDRVGEARVVRNLGVTERELHNHRSAADYYRQAIAAFDDVGDSSIAARVLADLAETETALGCYDEAAEHLGRALLAFGDVKDQHSQEYVLERAGELHLRRGHPTEAADFFKQALVISRRIDYPSGVASGLHNLGRVSLCLGRYRQATGYLRQALALFRELGRQDDEIETHRSLAEALHAAGQSAAARAELAAALRLAGETGNIFKQASAHTDLAKRHQAADHGEQARQHWQQALTLYTQLGAPEADQVRQVTQ